MRTSALFSAKTPVISKFMVCPHGQGGREIEPERTRGPNFSQFCADVLDGRPLTANLKL